MLKQQAHYRATIVDEKIELENGRSFSKTAVVEKWKGQAKVSSRKLGVPDLNEVYQAIFDKKEIDLSHCYLKDFSLKNYRKHFSIEEREVVSFKSLHADHAFFESEYGTDFSYSHLEGSFNSFAYSIFHQGEVNFGHIVCRSNLNFNRAEFYVESLNFKFAEFNKGDVRFTSCLFDCAELLFVNTNFGEGNVSFRQANFTSTNCNFQYAQFNEGDVSFDRAIFNGKVLDFRKIEFGSGKVEFRRVDFGDGNINFSESEFKKGKINFRHSIFGKGEKKFENISFADNQVFFDGSTFKEGQLSFHGSTFHTLSLADCLLGGHCDFRVKEGQLLDLSYSIVKEIVDFSAGLTAVKLTTLKIEGLKNLGKIFILWNENNAFNLINSQQNSSNGSKASQFNLLKESFHQNGKYNSEDKAYVAFKRFEMKAMLDQSENKGILRKLSSKLIYGFQWLVFDKAGLFATAPIRVFTSMLVALCFFSILYMTIPAFVHAEIVSSVGDPDHLNLLERSFYHSAITFFTIGYGDYYPSGHIRWLSAVEGWAGVFLMSYFTVAFVRKILR